MPYQQLRETGVYQVKRQPGDHLGYIAFQDFRRDPAGNPLDTPSGKLEIYCQQLSDTLTNMGWGRVRPLPTYAPGANGYESIVCRLALQGEGRLPLADNQSALSAPRSQRIR